MARTLTFRRYKNTRTKLPPLSSHPAGCFVAPCLRADARRMAHLIVALLLNKLQAASYTRKQRQTATHVRAAAVPCT